MSGYFSYFFFSSSDDSWILTPNVLRCNETEIILVHSFTSQRTCLKLQLKTEIDGKVINETEKVTFTESKQTLFGFLKVLKMCHNKRLQEVNKKSTFKN